MVEPFASRARSLLLTGAIVRADVQATAARTEAEVPRSSSTTSRRLRRPTRPSRRRSPSSTASATATAHALAALNDGAVPAPKTSPAATSSSPPAPKAAGCSSTSASRRDVKQVNTYSWHPAARGPQVYKLYASRRLRPRLRRPSPSTDTDPEQGRLEARSPRSTPAPRTASPAASTASASPTPPATPRQVPLPPLRRLRHRDRRRLRQHLLQRDRRHRRQGARRAAASSSDRSRRACHPPRRANVSPPPPPASTRSPSTISEMPELKEWVDTKLKPVCVEWYPKIVDMLPSDGYTAPQRFTITFHKDGRGVARAGGNRITCAGPWFSRNLEGEAVGAVVHEMVHVVQQYGRARGGNRNPGWLVEGLADYIRWLLYEPANQAPPHPPRPGQAHRQLPRHRRPSSTTSCEHHDKDIVRSSTPPCARASTPTSSGSSTPAKPPKSWGRNGSRACRMADAGRGIDRRICVAYRQEALDCNRSARVRRIGTGVSRWTGQAAHPNPHRPPRPRRPPPARRRPRRPHPRRGAQPLAGDADAQLPHRRDRPAADRLAEPAGGPTSGRATGISSWGLANARLEAWGPFGRGWSLRRFSVQVVEPQAIPLIGFPKAWSPGFDEPVVAAGRVPRRRGARRSWRSTREAEGGVVLVGATARPAGAVRAAGAARERRGPAAAGQLRRASTRPRPRPIDPAVGAAAMLGSTPLGRASAGAARSRPATASRGGRRRGQVHARTTGRRRRRPPRRQRRRPAPRRPHAPRAAAAGPGHVVPGRGRRGRHGHPQHPGRRRHVLRRRRRAARSRPSARRTSARRAASARAIPPPDPRAPSEESPRPTVRRRAAGLGRPTRRPRCRRSSLADRALQPARPDDPAGRDARRWPSTCRSSSTTTT